MENTPRLVLSEQRETTSKQGPVEGGERGRRVGPSQRLGKSQGDRLGLGP